jgi:hypothetical protein
MNLLEISNQKERNWQGMQHERGANRVRALVRKPERGIYLEALGVNERITLKCNLNKYYRCEGIH